MARAGVVAVLSGVVCWLPRLAVPLTTTACQCAERGTAVVFDKPITEREPAISLSGEACLPESVVCMHRDAKDRCDVFWIEPQREGLCVFTAHFADGAEKSASIDFDEDSEYPCRGNVRPRHDGVTRITSDG